MFCAAFSPACVLGPRFDIHVFGSCVMSRTRFCTSCQVTRPVEGGHVKQTRGVPRWMCRWCIEKAALGPRKGRIDK